jgi:hypothetical protein
LKQALQLGGQKMPKLKFIHIPDVPDQKDIEGLFESVAWTFEAINKDTGKTHTWRCFNADKERAFKKANKHLYIFN